MKGILSIRASKDSPWYHVPMVQAGFVTVFRLTGVIINNNDSYTDNPVVSVNFTYENGTPTHYRIGTSADLSNLPWIQFSQRPVSLTLQNYGTNNIYVQLKNEEVETSVKYNSINYIDNTVISITSFILASGQATYNKLTVPITLTANTTPTHYRIGESSDLSAVQWIAYPGSGISYTFSDYGSKVAYAQVKNATLESRIASASIVLEQQAVSTGKVYLGFNNSATGNVLKQTITGVSYNQINGNLNILNGSANLYKSDGSILSNWFFNFNKNVYYQPNNIFVDQQGAWVSLIKGEEAQLDTGDIPIAAYLQAIIPSNMNGKMRLSFTLPSGNYSIRFLWSGKSYVAMKESERLATHYAVCQGSNILAETQNGVGTGEGWTAFNNSSFHNELNFTISDSSIPVDLAAWSTLQGGRPGINLIELTKLS